MSARILDVSIDDYHADKIGGDRPALSASIATTLVTRSPLHAWSEHPKLGGVSRRPSRAMDLGTLVHELLLGKGGGYRVIDADDYRSKAAREARDEARIAGLTPVLAHELEGGEEVAAQLRRSLSEAGLPLDGESELAVSWEESSSVGPVLCRGMFDHLRIARGQIIDLKTTHNASPDTFERSMVERGHDIQAAAYKRALAQLRPDLAGRIDTVFVVVEMEPPYAVLVGSPAGDMAELGERRWRRAVETWARCLRDGRWPGYPTRRQDLHPPAWSVQREEFAS